MAISEARYAGLSILVMQPMFPKRLERSPPVTEWATDRVVR